MAFAAISLATTSCSDDDNAIAPGYDANYGTGDAPKVVSLSIENGAEDLDTIDSVEVKYDRPIFLPPNHSVRIETSNPEKPDSVLNTVYADSVKVKGDSTLVIYFNTAGYTIYNVTIRKPTVHNGSYAFADESSFKFTTGIASYFDPTPFNIDPEPSDPNATDEAKKLYEYLVSQFGKTVLSATMAETSGWDVANANTLFSMTGKYPAIATFDFLHLRWSKPLYNAQYPWIDYTDTKVVEDWADAGGIVAAGWHWNVPLDESCISDPSKYAFYCDSFKVRNLATFNVTNAYNKPGSWQNTQVNEDLDALASIFLQLQEKKIAILWRPMHEAAGKWFWWGNTTAARYKKLWQYVYNYLQNKGVHNLIWVWTSQGTSVDDALWYPGDEYVDIIGRDDYKDSHESLLAEFQKLTEITGGKKMVTLSECGSIPSVLNMATDGAMWSYAMPWYGEYMTSQYNSSDFFKAFMGSKYVITRDELPALR